MTTVIAAAEGRPYRTLSLLELCERIAGDGDPEAIRELHNHRRPVHRDGQRLHITAFVNELSETPRAWEWAGRNALVLDFARMHTMDKFSNIPDENRRRNRGPNAKWYFLAVALGVKAILAEMPAASALDEEQLTERRLQSMVTRHFFLSIREACRRLDKLVTRYLWSVDGVVLSLWMPVEIPGPDRRKWLEEHVGLVNPLALGEEERVQELVDRAVGRKRILPLSESAEDLIVAPSPAQPAWGEVLTVHGLTEAVVLEKEAHIDQQRPCLQALDGRLGTLIRKVFRDLAEGVYKPAEVAKAFGLSKSAMTRIGGVRVGSWDKSGIPDLFKNLAFVIAQHPHFVEAAKAAGIWDAVRNAADREVRGV
jgi:hypothetical protein